MSKIKQHWTVADIVRLGPCGLTEEDDGANYTRARITRLWDGRESLTPLEIAELDIPAEDRLWVLLRPEIIPERTLHGLACYFAESVLPIYEREYPGDDRPRLAIEAKRAWLRGEITDAELEAARAAAWAAASAAWEAAWAAARAAAWEAASAARAAAWAAAREERANQLARVVEVLRDGAAPGEDKEGDDR